MRDARRRALVAGGLALSLASGCGSAPSPPGEGSASTATLTVRFDPGQGALAPARRPGTRVIECPGDRLCGRVTALDGADFAPVDPQRACTALYGGPATATVDGTLDGEAVHARFTKRNGCEIARWERLGWLLVPPRSQ